MKKLKVKYNSFFTIDDEKNNLYEYIVVKREKYGKRELTIQWEFDRWKMFSNLKRKQVRNLIRDAYLRNN